MGISEKNEIRLGDFIIVNDAIVKVTRVDESEGVSGGLLSHSDWKSVEVPRLTDEFFEKNDFKKTRRNGVTTYKTGSKEINLVAIKREKFYDVHIRNRVYEFNGPIDSVNHLIHALESCSIVNTFSL